ncbi:MAG: nucleoside deaminase [Corynebacterium sp.]|uniref:nucleoside deaminase n=1 Tax=uncultured Corynebacterium sp. TaxID=159447 RepID=UPI0018544216|nr:nucleoside deaminase [uncultured Corynebacterium sp.]NLZ57992.1 nucleoside deaminase [Corynebacterium sp.]
MFTDTAQTHLRRCVALAATALDKGNSPYGSVLVSDTGQVLFEDHNRDGDGDNTRHPEFEIARWAAANLSEKQRATAVVYTSTEHCPMCAAAHAWVGLGRIIYISSGAEVGQWYRQWGAEPTPVAKLPITQVAPGLSVEGPVPELTDKLKEIHRRYFQRAVS